MTETKILGPDPRKAFTYQELPIGSTITGIEPDTARTGTWRFYRPVFTPSLAPCSEACPAGVDVRGLMAAIKKKRFREAFLQFMEENPFPGICANMCTHPCEAACNRGSIDSALSARAIEEVISKLDVAVEPVSNSALQAHRIAVAGGGAAAASCSYFLARLGYRPVLFQGDGLEAALRQDPGYRTTKGLVGREIRRIIEQGVTMRSGKWGWDDLAGFEAVFLTIVPEAAGDPPGRQLRLEKGKVPVNTAGETDRPGVFAGGEAVWGAQNIVEAIADGKRVAAGINAYVSQRDALCELEGLPAGEKGGFSFHDYKAGIRNEGRPTRVVRFSDLNPSILPAGSSQKSSKRIPAGRSKASDEGGLTRSQEGAIREASRCLDCGTCGGCGRCVLYCPEGAVSRALQSSTTMEIDYAFCKGCGICRNECPHGMFVLRREENEWE